MNVEVSSSIDKQSGISEFVTEVDTEQTSSYELCSRMVLNK